MRIVFDAPRFAAAALDVPGQAAWRVRVGARYLLALCGTNPAEGCLDLLEAHAVLVQENPSLADIRLVVVCPPDHDQDPDEVATFWSRTHDLGADPMLVRPVPAEMPALVAGATAVGYLPTEPSTHGRALEALAAGVPVVARDLPGIREVLGDAVAYGDTVLSIADALVDVLTDPPEPTRGVAHAAAWAARSSAQRSAQ
ncbi:glycosyltransferase [Nocardioides stalactiti]|uniref:glycosyltransferase n=1 Tax=Nocardioides stalactiti TaxID=2755356 RepID=UPI00160109B6|nr:glycosyltransferase [Nocardioides stalactiti]